MRPISAKEMDSVLRLDGPTRFEHFIKRVVDTETAWGMWHNGWDLMENDDGVQVFPLWPAREYAALFQQDAWATHEPKSISLTEVLDWLVPRMKTEKILPGIFPTPTGKGVTPTPIELEVALRTELERYE